MKNVVKAVGYLTSIFLEKLKVHLLMHVNYV